jgi:hypothetical protein
MIMFRIARDFEILRFYYHIGLRDLQSMYPASNRTLTEEKAKPRGRGSRVTSSRSLDEQSQATTAAI